MCEYKQAAPDDINKHLAVKYFSFMYQTERNPISMDRLCYQAR